MSSANLVKLSFIEETTYGETPAVGNFQSARFTSESISGTPETTESQQIRTDRLSSGQVAVGTTVGGSLNFELAKETALEEFMESAMFNVFTTTAAVSADLTIDATASTITRTDTDFAGLAVGDFVNLTGFTNAVNNVIVFVAEVVSNTVIRYVGRSTMVDEAATGGTYQKLDTMGIGTTKKSFSIEKQFTDLTDKAIIYKGCIANTMNISAAYGEIVTGSFELNANYQLPVDNSADFITDGRTVGAQATSQSLNGSIDLPYIAANVNGTLDGVPFCIQSLEISLNNNNQPLTCIGYEAPINFDPGTAQVEVNLSSYLSDENWQLLTSKKTQESFALSFILENEDGAYCFYLPAVQVSFDDPSSGGANQLISIDMTGMAKVGANGESSLYVSRSV